MNKLDFKANDKVELAGATSMANWVKVAPDGEILRQITEANTKLRQQCPYLPQNSRDNEHGEYHRTTRQNRTKQHRKYTEQDKTEQNRTEQHNNEQYRRRTWRIFLVSASASAVGKILIPAVANHMKGVVAHADRGKTESGKSVLKWLMRSLTYVSTSSSLSGKKKEGGGNSKWMINDHGRI